MLVLYADLRVLQVRGLGGESVEWQLPQRGVWTFNTDVSSKLDDAYCANRRGPWCAVLLRGFLMPRLRIGGLELELECACAMRIRALDIFGNQLSGSFPSVVSGLSSLA